MIDLQRAHRFVALHGRLIDRRRIAADPDLIRSALAAHRNPDGGFAYLEPDLPDAASQPVAALAALEVLHEIGAPGDDPLITGLAGWLPTITNSDGGIPNVVPFDADAVPHAPWMAPDPAAPSSLLMTAAVSAAAQRAGMRAPWLDGASGFVWDHIPRLDPTAGYQLKYVIDFLDAAPDRDRADRALERVAEAVGGRGALRVSGGVDGEEVTALVVCARPDHAGRRLFDPEALERQLDDLAAGQQPDGGWTFDWLDWNPAVTWEWRARLTVDALRTLAANGRIAWRPGSLQA
jgi:hypothetical protein